MKSIEKSVYISVLTEKKFTVNFIPFNGKIYEEDVDWIAYWFYTYHDTNINDLIINIKGNIHSTYPNKPHISVTFEYNGYKSPVYHLTNDIENGMVYMQPLPGGPLSGKKRRSNKKKAKRKKSKTKKK